MKQDPNAFLRLLFLCLIVMLGGTLVFGRGGLLQRQRLDDDIARQQEVNNEMLQKNIALEAQVRDLKNSGDALEEQAREDLGMIRDREIYYRYHRDPIPAKKGTTTNGY